MPQILENGEDATEQKAQTKKRETSHINVGLQPLHTNPIVRPKKGHLEVGEYVGYCQTNYGYVVNNGIKIYTVTKIPNTAIELTWAVKFELYLGLLNLEQ